MQTLKKYLPFGVILVSSVFFVWFAFSSKGNWGGADSYVHYRISRYSWKYPHLFLDLWGKPVFNILSSPFSQFGFIGIKIFNVVVAILTSWVLYDITRIFRWSVGLAVIPFLLCAPIYFIVIPSGLTEPLFGLIITFAVWCFFKDKFILASIIISFLPFARNEGFVILPIFLLAFLISRQYKSIPFLLTGFVILSAAGWKYYSDFLWIIHFKAGEGSGDIYGSGRLLHFILSSNEIFGFPILIFFLTGVFYSLKNLYDRSAKRKENLTFVLLILGSFSIYFAAHSYVWWKGIGGSMGLTRVMGGIVPLAALIAARGMQGVFEEFKTKKAGFYIFELISISIVIYFPFAKFHHQLPMKTNGLNERLIFFYDPLIPHYMGKDPFDNKSVIEVVSDREHPENAIPEGSLVVWDAHFGPNEGRLPLDRLLKNNSFTLLKKVAPDRPFKTLNDYNYEIYVFERNVTSSVEEARK